MWGMSTYSFPPTLIRFVGVAVAKARMIGDALYPSPEFEHPVVITINGKTNAKANTIINIFFMHDLITVEPMRQ